LGFLKKLFSDWSDKKKGSLKKMYLPHLNGCKKMA
jgi:hypothetical protein